MTLLQNRFANKRALCTKSTSNSLSTFN